MSAFYKLRNFINSKKCDESFTMDDVYNIYGDEDLGFCRAPQSLLTIYLNGFEKAGVIEADKQFKQFTIKKKITEKITLYDFLETINGGNWKEWFIQICE